MSKRLQKTTPGSKSGSASAVANSRKFTPFLSLESSLNDPTLQVFKNDRFVCIRDKYPKARFHLLLVPRDVKLNKVEDLIRLDDAVKYLKDMRQLAKEIVEKNCPSKVSSKIHYGFHSIQSMSPLHMHIISSDFVSDCLKHKKHWNSFTSPYFIHLDDLIQNLESVTNYFAEDKFNLNKPSVLKDYLESPLKCHVCKQPLSNIPNLKKHILTHL